MKITFRRRTLVLALLLLVGISGLLLLPPGNGPGPHAGQTTPATLPQSQGSPDSAAALADPAQAAVQFVQDFYTVDYRQRDQWLGRLKPLASADGYTLLKNMVAPSLWSDLTQAQTVVTADQVSVADHGLKDAGVSKRLANTAWQIRGVTITLAPGVKWPGLSGQTYATNILLSQEQGAWKFVMLMSDDQTRLFQAQTKGVP